MGAGLLCLVGGCGAAGADTPGQGVTFRPSESLVRLRAERLDGDDIGLVRDFDISGDTVYLLDVTGRVAVVERDTSGLRLVGHFARQGAGPGELLRPTGIALAGGSVAVMDGTRLQLFSRSGEFLESRQVTLPCMMMLPSIAAARNGFFVHGGCLQRGIVTDTMKAVLAWSADTSAWEVIVQTPRFTSDGSVGTVFGVRSLLTTGADERHVFGGGETNCFWSILDRGGRPSAEQTCPAVDVLYSADPPPAVAERLRAGRIAGMKIEWPETLPVYMERFAAGGETLLLRPFSADSLVLQSAAPASIDFAVAPLDGLIGCKAGGCVWLLEDDLVPRLIVLDRARIEAMIGGAVR